MTRKDNAAEIIKEFYHEMMDGTVSTIEHEHDENGSYSQIRISNDEFTGRIAVGRGSMTNYRSA